MTTKLILLKQASLQATILVDDVAEDMLAFEVNLKHDLQVQVKAIF